ncbi:MAG: 16S rRNA (cytosine(1402)-N(4))-methyltransferase RsmH, partial [Desulfovibrionales bacterium]
MLEHLPVLVSEVVTWLNPGPGKRFLDGTAGLGGHGLALLQATGGRLEYLGIDRDQNALDRAQARLSEFHDVHLAHADFDRFPAVLAELGWESVHGALLDLGISSLQLDTAERGFSFLREGPLDMRMDTGGGEAPAWNLVNRGSFSRLKYVIRTYGEEPLAGRIADTIVREREKKHIETTLELADIVSRAYPAARRAKSRNHPETKTFQAIRMAVNEELGSLENFLDRIVDYLAPGGRIGVISFHSLEDRLVKRAFQREAKGCTCPKDFAVCVCGGRPRVEILTKKPVIPQQEEVERNPRSRSAKF